MTKRSNIEIMYAMAETLLSGEKKQNQLRGITDTASTPLYRSIARMKKHNLIAVRVHTGREKGQFGSFARRTIYYSLTERGREWYRAMQPAMAFLK